jgi:micrococcal nuclease
MGNCLCWKKRRLRDVTLKNVEPFSFPLLDFNNELGKIVKVIDGDTYWIALYIQKLNQVLRFKIRLDGADTPESRRDKAKSDLEVVAGKMISKYVRKELLNKYCQVKLNTQSNDMYGRVLANIIIDGVDFKEFLINSGYAKVYGGGHKEWTKEELQHIVDMLNDKN